MKEDDVTPGTIYPLLGKLLCFLPEHLKKKLCCVTPLGEMVSYVVMYNNDLKSNTHETYDMTPAQY